MFRRRLIGGLASLGPIAMLPACQAVRTGEADDQPVRYTAPRGIGSILLVAPIVPQTRELLRRDLYRLINVGAFTIRLAINSTGGSIAAAQAIVDDMNSMRATQKLTFETYAVGTVASAATYVFLHGQRRFVSSGGRIVFLGNTLVNSGGVSAERLRDEVSRMERYEQRLRALLKARTKLTDATIDVYLRQQVALTAEDALRDGVVDGIAEFPRPSDGKVLSIMPRPRVTAGGTPATAPVIAP